jgi:tetraacyldisaccharide 4'-kinase
LKATSLQSATARWLHRQWQKRGLWAGLLWPVSCLALCYVSAKRRWYQPGGKRVYRAPVPVVIVGNIYVGGVGKTPVLIALVQQLVTLGWNPGVISRGYGVKLGSTPRVGRDELDARSFGDEPALISQQTHAPVGVHPNRRLACQALLQAYPEVDIIVSDDGLQHLALARDVEILVQDARQAGNGWLLPAGPLREPPSRLRTVDLVITRQAIQPQHFEQPPARKQPAEVSMWLQITGIHSLDKKINLSVNEFIKKQKNKSSCAIAAISEPDRFFQSLGNAAIRYQSSIGLPDHHPLDAAFFKTQQADLLLITTKDAVKCRSLHDPRIWVVDTQAVFSDPFWAASLSAQLTHRATAQPE